MKIDANGYFQRVEDISRNYLVERDIIGIILDIDNTVVIDGKTEVIQSVVEWITNINLPICLLSNAKEERVKIFADIFGLNYVCRAKKPLKKGFKEAARRLCIDNYSKIAVIGDQLFSDILGGNLVGCYTIKLEPIDTMADPLEVKIKRWFERFVR